MLVEMTFAVLEPLVAVKTDGAVKELKAKGSWTMTNEFELPDCVAVTAWRNLEPESGGWTPASARRWRYPESVGKPPGAAAAAAWRAASESMKRKSLPTPWVRFVLPPKNDDWRERTFTVPAWL